MLDPQQNHLTMIMIRMNVSRHENQIQELEKDVELTEGFLTDFELAEGPWSDDTPKRNDIVTGTFSVMASSLLETIAQATSKGESVAESVLHLPEHDVESFAWVFLFVVYKSALDIAKDGTKALKEDLQNEFRALFPGISPSTILKARDGLRHRGASDCVVKHLRDQWKDPLFPDLVLLIRDEILIPRLPQPMPAPTSLRAAFLKSRKANEPPKPEPLTHKILLDAFNLYLKLDDISKGDDVSKGDEATESDASD
ncbi:hypothetical protein BD310DRAFT_828283 [Dichomitus squalens]|uniref:Fungal-type protein kinase domain-containing protein n=1 Tax=Dichomitus squalens TaxID=114155 RepID=A0A4Q9PJL6_9APHY|nr:hypothetical protein BD310DRAFT_828283 [Dichomitus squalens]